MRAPFGRMLMCHMFADTPEELHAMADRIGVARRWCQHKGTPREHYDICLSKRRRAVAAGAIEVSWHDYGRWCNPAYAASSAASPAGDGET